MHKTIYILGLGLLLGACDGFFGVETPTDFLDEPQFDDKTVAYVPIQPVWEGFVDPVDIIAGWDELIYIADGGAEEIISFDQAGNELGRFKVPGLQSISQDRRLDILATGRKDTVINGSPFNLPAIYRISLNKNGDYGLQNAAIVKTIVHPFFFKSSTPTSNDELAAFEAVAPMGNNRYYVARSGVSNSPNQFGGPDNAVLIFDENDVFESPVFVSTNLGLFRDYFKDPSSIVSVAQPPQSPAVNNRGDFYFSSLSDNALSVQGIRFTETEGGFSYDVINFIIGTENQADGFLYEANKFSSPVDITLAGDGTNYIFVVDSEKDSLFQFNALGYEGVNPPAGSSSDKAIRASFGGTGEELTQFRNPKAVAYLDQIVYVADAGNNRILRFKLTTDFE
ncbi:MAG: hypothetical protein AAF696_00220 [Bacteroidota bacterium]